MAPQRVVLELIGVLDDEELFGMRQATSKKVIYGFSNYGEWFTLYDCFTAGAQMSAPGFETISYTVNRFYAGSRLIRDENNEIIEDITFSFTYLDAWMDISVDERREYRGSSRIEWEIDLNKALPQKKCINIHSENISIDEEIGYRIVYPETYFSSESTEIIINRFYRLSLTNKNCFSYNAYSDALHKIRRLLTMLMGIPLHFLYIDINLSAIKEAVDNDEVYDKETNAGYFLRKLEKLTNKEGSHHIIPKQH